MSDPGWYADPLEGHELRYYDGAEWTEHVADAGVVTSDPLPRYAAASDSVADRQQFDPAPVYATPSTAAPQQQNDVVQKRYCARCGANVGALDAGCDNCGSTSFRGAEPPPASSWTPAVRAVGSRCVQCGSAMAEDALGCGVCGADRPSHVDPWAGPPPSSPGSAPAVGASGGGIYTSLAPGLAAQQLVHLLAQLGASVTAQTPTTITGNVLVRNRASMVVAVLLFLLCIVPFILYLMSANKDRVEPFTLTLVPEGAGTRIHGAGQGEGLAIARRAAESLPR